MVTGRPDSVCVRCGRYSTDPNATICRQLTASRGRCGGTFRPGVRAVTGPAVSLVVAQARMMEPAAFLARARAGGMSGADLKRGSIRPRPKPAGGRDGQNALVGEANP